MQRGSVNFARGAAGTTRRCVTRRAATTTPMLQRLLSRAPCARCPSRRGGPENIVRVVVETLSFLIYFFFVVLFFLLGFLAPMDHHPNKSQGGVNSAPPLPGPSAEGGHRVAPPVISTEASQALYQAYVQQAMPGGAPQMMEQVDPAAMQLALQRHAALQTQQYAQQQRTELGFAEQTHGAATAAAPLAAAAIPEGRSFYSNLDLRVSAEDDEESRALKTRARNLEERLWALRVSRSSAERLYDAMRHVRNAPGRGSPPPYRMEEAKRLLEVSSSSNEEEPAAEESHTLSPVRFKKFSEEWVLLKKALVNWNTAVALWKIGKEYAKEVAVQEAERKAQEEEEEKYQLELLERREVDRLREQQQAAACANGCVCVCAYGFSRKRHLSAMGSPLVSRNVSTFNANV